ncbi:MAG: GGDEF domain-containing protein [candidate division WOR-3 bacterium]|nr:MAG: GGDEF domain-containing protein [candidate division WOR-3 bacterium]
MKVYWLLLLDCGKVAKQVPLGKDRCIIGRAEDTDLTLGGHDVSRHHAAVFFQNGRYFIEDLNSTNGTILNGVSIEHDVLAQGDQISIGEHTILFDDGTSTLFNIEETEVARRGRETAIIKDKFNQLGKKIDSRSLRNEFEEIEKFVRKSRKRLATLVHADKLTGLYNRQYFDRIAPQEIKKAKAARRQLSVLFIDLDHFKDINDQHGHRVGDEVLRAIAWLIQKACRKTDLVARYGGEEIVVVLPNTNGRDAGKIAEEIRGIIESQSKGRLNIPVTVSIGFATFPGDGKDLSSILDHADKALYQAKASGRNCVARYRE